jgi:hypothetical protein
MTYIYEIAEKTLKTLWTGPCYQFQQNQINMTRMSAAITLRVSLTTCQAKIFIMNKQWQPAMTPH